MTDKELQKVKERCLYKKELENIREQILELEQDPKLKQYFSLVKELEKKTKDDKPIIISKENSNNLLFEYDRLSIRENPEDYLTSYVWIYRDLETKEYFYRTAYYAYKKIYRSCILDKIELEQMDNQFDIMREYFFEQLLNKPQQQVVWEILENNKRLVKGRKHEFLF